jgi:hypothetical protein
LARPTLAAIVWRVIQLAAEARGNIARTKTGDRNALSVVVVKRKIFSFSIDNVRAAF